jgi:acyl-CoA synthetase (AMP-forming)/AMP-acid ligase II
VHGSSAGPWPFPSQWMCVHASDRARPAPLRGFNPLGLPFSTWALDLGIDPDRLTPEDLARIPTTPKQALQAESDAFARTSARPVLQALTTGTTRRPTGVHFSADELHALVSFSALGFLFQRQLAPEDIVQISTPARAVLGNLGLAGACGAPVRQREDL